MTPREIIAEAWAITTREKPIRRWAFTSSFFETLLNLKLLIYQLYFAYKYFHEGTGAGFFDIEILIYQKMPFWVFLTVIILFILLVLVELVMPHFCLGAIIGLGARAHRKEELKGGLVFAIYNFFPIFGLHEFLVLRGLSTTITVISLILRYIDEPLKTLGVVMTIILYVVANILKFLFSFAEEGVVIRKEGVFVAMGRSFKLVLSYLKHVVFLILLLVVISVRIFLNIVMVLVVPGVVIGLALLLSTFLSMTASYLISGIIGLLLIGAASYFFAYLHAFKQNVWTVTYLELSAEKDVDVIETK